MGSRIALALLAVGAPLLLSACGTDPTDRTVSGAGIGAAGGATGALTSPSQVDLGKPIWHDSADASPGPAGAVDTGTVRTVQAELEQRGYNIGAVDGRLGPRTQTAIREYQQRNSLPVDGQPSSSLLDYMQQHPTG